MIKSTSIVVGFGLWIFFCVGCDQSSEPSQSSTEFERQNQVFSTIQKPESGSDSLSSTAPSSAVPINSQFSKETFLNAALTGNQTAIEAMLQSHSDQFDMSDPDGRTALMLACFNGHTSVAKRLLEAGAKVDAVDVTNRTALIYAASGSDLEVVQLLIDHKANINAVDNVQHWSPLMFAASEGQIKVVELLLEHGADHKAKDIDGEDCIDFARSRGHADVVWLLEQAKK